MWRQRVCERSPTHFRDILYAYVTQLGISLHGCTAELTSDCKSCSVSFSHSLLKSSLWSVFLYSDREGEIRAGWDESPLIENAAHGSSYSKSVCLCLSCQCNDILYASFCFSLLCLCVQAQVRWNISEWIRRILWGELQGRLLDSWVMNGEEEKS